MKQLVDWLTIKPAGIFQLPYGRLEEGGVADFTLVSFDEENKVDRNALYSKGKNTPFHGWTVRGIPSMTVVNGDIVYKEDAHD